MAVTLRLTLAKVTGWLRWSASQPEPLIGKCDEDVLVVPPMLEAYATLLCNMSLHAGASMHGGREPAQVLAILTLNPNPNPNPGPNPHPQPNPNPHQVLAGVFEWYSWAPATLAAKVSMSTAAVRWAGR